MQLATVLLAAGLAATAAAACTPAVCPAGRPNALCCNSAAENEARPGQKIPFSCYVSTQTTAAGFRDECSLNVGACCTAYSLTPRGYTGTDCVLLWDRDD